jgi:hypothetical protein
MPEIDPLNYTSAQPDVATRMMLERLARSGPIFKISRFVKKGPLCPCAVLWLETTSEPGCPENDMRGTRSPHVAGFVSGQYVQPERVYTSGGPGTTYINRAQYAAALAEIAANVGAGRYEARATPFERVKIAELPLPLWERTR